MSKKKLTAGLAAVLASLILLSSTSCSLIVVNDLSSQETEDDETESDKDVGGTVSESGKEYNKYHSTEDGLSISKAYLAELPKRNYDGGVFFITTPDRSYIAPDDTETSVSRLAYERNAMVEELLNVSIITSVDTDLNMLEAMKQSVEANSYYTDLLMLPIYRVGQFREEGVLVNMLSLPFLDVDQPYFYKESSDMTLGGNSIYAIAGQASIAPTSLSAVFMNTDLLETAGVDTDAVYEMAETGTWTLDEMLKCAEAITALNKSGAAGRDFYTVTVQSASSRLPDLLFKAAGWDFVKTATRKTPVIGYKVSTVQHTLDGIAKIYNDPKAILDGTAGAVDCFNKGESAFLIDYLAVMPEISNARDSWGILPLPKNTAWGKYRTLVSNSELVFSVPVNHTNGEYAAIVLSALNAASCGYIYDEYVEYNMLHVLRDNESIAMLDMILDTASFDFALAFGNAYPEIANATYKLLRSTAKANNLAELFDDRAAKANDVMAKKFDLKP